VATLLLHQWSPHWDLSKPVLVEKSPPNLVITRFLQGAFPDARFVMVVRHPAIVSLSTRKWARLRSLGALLDHWFAAHRTFEEDAAFLHHLLVVKYEHLVADPEGTLAEIPADSIDTRRSATYERQWAELATGGPWRRERFRSLCRRHEEAANHFGYSLLDLDRADPFPVGSTRPS
jgi:hypothetical protein